jgi:hypothetical protein
MKRWRQYLSHIAGAALAVTAVTSFSNPAAASGVDGAARTIVIPLVMNGPDRASSITITNPGRETIEIETLYIPARGTPAWNIVHGPGAIACQSVKLDPENTVTLGLESLCPATATRDAENYGYLELHSGGDSAKLFFASSWNETRTGYSFAVDGYPVGAFDPSRVSTPAIPLVPPFPMPGLRVVGLQTSQSGGFFSERIMCYAASLQEPKRVELIPHVGGVALAPVAIALKPREMERIDVTGMIRGGSASNVTVEFSASDAGQLVGGCAVESEELKTLDFRPAHTLHPRDMSRLREVAEDSGLAAGPYVFAYTWSNTLVGDPRSTKVVLSSYVQTDDEVQCRLEQPSGIYPNFDPTPWLELRVVDPEGNVRAGGNGVKDTGKFSTGVRNSLKNGYQNRWLIEISFDEDHQAQQSWPTSEKTGGWGLRCFSAAGMSHPLLVGHDDFTAFKDDF